MKNKCCNKKEIECEKISTCLFSSSFCGQQQMYFITPSDPKIILFGIYENQIYGFGEKNGKLCIYTKAIFDIGEWKEFYLTDINVVKCEECDSGIHVAGGVFYTEESALATYGRVKNIWIAARENEFTRVFSIDIDTMEFIRHEVECPPEYTNLDINLCSKCLSPVIRPCKNYDFVSFDIVPQKYQSNIGIFKLYAVFYQSNICVLWKTDTFTLRRPPLTGFSNILNNPVKEEVLSVFEKDEKTGRLCTFSKESADSRQYVTVPDNCQIDWIWHEISFCKQYCLTRRKEENKSILRIFSVVFRSPIGLGVLNYCTVVDAKFPSLQSTHFFISWSIVDKEYVTATSTEAIFSEYLQQYVIPSIVVFQTADGSGIVTIPFRVLSLSEAAYLSLARISYWPLQRQRSLPVAKVSIYYRFFQRIRRILCGRSKINVSKKELSKEVIQCDPWMTQDFIKDAIGWPKILPLTKAPNLPKK